jgi:hypothetical protein
MPDACDGRRQEVLIGFVGVAPNAAAKRGIGPQHRRVMPIVSSAGGSRCRTSSCVIHASRRGTGRTGPRRSRRAGARRGWDSAPNRTDGRPWPAIHWWESTTPACLHGPSDAPLPRRKSSTGPSQYRELARPERWAEAGVGGAKAVSKIAANYGGKLAAGS